MSGNRDIIKSIWSELNLQDLLNDRKEDDFKDDDPSEHQDSNRKTSREIASQLDDDDRSSSNRVKDESLSPHKSPFDRLSDPLRGRYANFDDLVAADDKKKRINSQVPISNSNRSRTNAISSNSNIFIDGNYNSPKLIKKSIRSPTHILKDLSDNSGTCLSPRSSVKLSPRFDKQFYNHSAQKNDLKIKNNENNYGGGNDSKGFFLTEAIDDYDNDGFEQDNSAGLIKQKESKPDEENSFESKKVKFVLGSENKNSSISPSKAKMKILKEFEQNPIFNDDLVLSRVSKRLEEATKLEYLIQENIRKEELKKIGVKKDQKFNDYRVKPNKYGPIRTNEQKYSMKSHPLLKPQNGVPRKKAWEDPLTKSQTKSNRIIKKVVLSSSIEKNPINSFLSKFTKNKNLISNNDKRMDNVILKKNTSLSRDHLNQNKDRRDNKFNLSQSNKKDKKDVFLSQLDGSSRKNRISTTNLKDQNSYGNNNKTRISNTIGNSRKDPDSRVLPLIKERKNLPKHSSSYGTKSLSNQDNNSTFITDIDSSPKKAKDFQLEKKSGKRIVKAEIVNKRMLSRSTPNLNHLERVDSMDAKKGTGIQFINKERRAGSLDRTNRERIIGGDNITVNRKESSVNKFLQSSSSDWNQSNDKELRTRKSSIVRKSSIGGNEIGNSSDASNRFDTGVGVKKNASRVSFDLPARTNLTDPLTSSNIGKDNIKKKSGNFDNNDQNTNDDLNDLGILNLVSKKDMKKTMVISQRKTSDIIDLLSQVELKEHDRFKESKGDLKDGDNAAAQLMKHARRLGGHWAAAESYASKYNDLETPENQSDED